MRACYLYIATLLFFLTAFACFSKHIPTKDSIHIPLNNWSSQRVLSIAVGQLIETLSIKVEYVDINAESQWGALQRGTIDFQVEVWQPSMAQVFNQLVNKGAILDMGRHEAVVIEDWWYPEYVETDCPNLPDWKALNSCYQLFVGKESINKGIYYSGPWDYGDADIIRALDLKFTIRRLPNELSLWNELSNAIENKRPIILLNWSPNWTDNYIKGKFINFPSYAPECEKHPEWGLNKNLVKDCGNPNNGWLKKAAWPGLKKTRPCVYELVKNISFTNEMIAYASALVVVEGHSELSAATLWLKRYNNQTQRWLPHSCR